MIEDADTEILEKYTETTNHLIETQKNLAAEQANNTVVRKRHAAAVRELHDALIQIDQQKQELTMLKRAWYCRFGTSIMNFIAIFFPHGTKRRRYVKFIKFSLFHPVLLVKNLKPSKLKALYRAITVIDTPCINNEISNEVFYEKLSLPIYSNPVVSIIIPVYNEFAYTYSCIESILGNTLAPYEIIVADDCSSDETKSIEKIIANVIHIRNENNLRFLHNCNNAAKYAKGKYIYFLNNDTQVKSDWLDSLVEIMERDSTIGLVGSKLLYPDGRLQEAGAILWNDGSAWNYRTHEDPERPEFNYVKDVDYISGAAIMVRKAVWDELGGFDTHFAPAYCEDSDLAFSIRKLGYRTVYQPKSVVVHFEGVSHGTDTSTGIKQYQVENMQKFYKKWKAVLDKDHFPNGESVFYARDRNRYKKTILFIDHYVPMFDQDAGSRNTFAYVKLCVELNYNVLFLGDNFYPHQPYTDILQQMGVEVLYGTWYHDNWQTWFIDNNEYIDYIFMNRAGVSVKYMDFVKENMKAKIIFHGHDLHFVRMRAQYEIEKDEQLLIDAEHSEKIECEMFSKADVILTLSNKEQEIIKEITGNNKPVIVFPIFFYDSFPNVTPFYSRKDLIYVGGFRHPPNEDAILWFTSAVMPLLPSDTRLILVGTNMPESIQALASEQIDIRGFVSDDELESLYKSCRIAINPVRFGAGVKGKTIEAMHNLMPVVATSFGIEGLSEIEEIIPPCDDAESFADEVLRFLKSDKECIEACKMYKAWLEKWFSKERAIEVVEKMTDNS
ncbi:MAG: glycosyltransferase [Oscillospiraceae bacterium]|nr:glycosyltransferase [Oscillospiraceae bacterium]